MLSAPVTFPEEERTLRDTVDLILARVSEATGAEVRCPFPPLNLFRQRRITLGARGESARELLQEVLEDLNPPADGSEMAPTTLATEIGISATPQARDPWLTFRPSRYAWRLFFEPRDRRYSLSFVRLPGD